MSVSDNIIITNDKTALHLHRVLRALERVVHDFETDIRSGNRLIQMGILTQGMQKDFDELSTKLDIAYQQIDFLTTFLENENKFNRPFQIKFKKRFLTKKVFEQSTWRDVFMQKLNEIKEESESRKKKGKTFSIQVLWRHEGSNTYLKKIKGEWL
jgi:hypothetical protein